MTLGTDISSLKMDKPEKPDKLVSFADDDLYSVKKRGQNKVCLYRQEYFIRTWVIFFCDTKNEGSTITALSGYLLSC